MLMPLLNDPFEAVRITIDSGLMDGQISIFVLGVENLVQLSVSFRSIQHIVQNMLLVKRTFRDYSHEGELVYAYLFDAFSAATSHFRSKCRLLEISIIIITG